MSLFTSQCASCGNKVRHPETKVCRACFLKEHHAPGICTDCGIAFKFNKRRNTLCRTCWLKRHPVPTCSGCNGKLTAGSASATGLCWACYTKDAKPAVCLDCAKELPNKSKGKRCWECWSKLRTSRERKTCAIAGCERPHQAKGLCLFHYQHERRRYLAPAIDRKARVHVGSLPCAACGYSDLRSEVHRLVPKGPYIIGNMVPLCSNCHRKVTLGKMPSPSAWQPGQLTFERLLDT